MKIKHIYSVSVFYSMDAVFPELHVFTKKSVAVNMGKYFAENGAKLVKVIDHSKDGITTISRKEIYNYNFESQH